MLENQRLRRLRRLSSLRKAGMVSCESSKPWRKSFRLIVYRLMSNRLSSPLVSCLPSHVSCPPHEKAIQIAFHYQCQAAQWLNHYAVLTRDVRRETRDVHKDIRRLDKEAELIVWVAASGHFKQSVWFVVPWINFGLFDIFNGWFCAWE